MQHQSPRNGDLPGFERGNESPFELEFAVGKLRRARISILYRLGIVAVAATMVLLPLLYAALVVGLAVALGKFAVLNFPPAGHYPSMLLYGAVLVSGVTVIAFLVKPLFVREIKKSTAIELEPEEQERLQKLVADLSGIVGASMPARVAVDCSVNASVSFRRGMLSLFGSDLILVIGLPLVRNLDPRSFAGVIAHELGHFAQGAGMRLTYVIRRLNGWFYGVVYARDGWDHWLCRGALTSRLGLLFQVAQLGIWCARRVLFLLMLVGQAVSCFVLRRMEFDADHYEIYVAGTDGFRETTERIALLHEAAAGTRGIVDEALAGGSLPDDFPLLISNVAGMTSTAAKARISKRMTDTGGGLLDSHPSDWDRIGRALAMREPGVVVYSGERNAGELFNNLDTLSKRATACHFAVVDSAIDIGAARDGIKWVPARQLAASEQRNRELEQAADRFAGCRVELWDGSIRAVPPAIDRNDDEESLKRSLRKVTRAFNGSAARCAKISRAISELDNDYGTALKGKELMFVGYSLNRQARTRVTAGLGQRQELAKLREELTDFQSLASQRLGLALALKPPVGEEAKSLPAALAFLEACCRLRPTVNRLRELLLRQTILIQHIEPGRDSSFEFRSRFQANAAHLRIVYCDLVAAMEEVRDPISGSPMTVGKWLCSSLQAQDFSNDPGFRGYQQAEEILRRLGKRYRQVLGVAATSVFSAEASLQAGD